MAAEVIIALIIALVLAIPAFFHRFNKCQHVWAYYYGSYRQCVDCGLREDWKDYLKIKGQR